MLDELNFKEYIIHNNILTRSQNIKEKAIEKPSIYELIRIINSCPLFLEDHLDRLIKSIKMQGLQSNIDIESIKKHIRGLCAKNEIVEGYLKMMYFFTKSRIEDVFFYFVKHFQPSPEDYINGVKTTYLSAERNMPNVKLLNLNLRIIANEIKESKNVYEVLLVDKNGFVTEGSRSNMFLIKGNDILTPPSKDVLEGVTRKHIVEICYKNNMKCIEKNILKKDIQHMDAIFITGTSSKILPVRSIDDYSFDVSNELMKKLMILYENRIRQYINV